MFDNNIYTVAIDLIVHHIRDTILQPNGSLRNHIHNHNNYINNNSNNHKNGLSSNNLHARQNGRHAGDSSDDENSASSDI